MIQQPSSIKGYYAADYKAGDSIVRLYEFYAVQQANGECGYLTLLDAVSNLDTNTLARCKIKFSKVRCGFGGLYVMPFLMLDGETIDNLPGNLCVPGAYAVKDMTNLNILDPEQLNSESLLEFRQHMEYMTSASFYLLQLLTQENEFVKGLVDVDDLVTRMVKYGSERNFQDVKPYKTYEDYISKKQSLKLQPTQTQQAQPESIQLQSQPTQSELQSKTQKIPNTMPSETTQTSSNESSVEPIPNIIPKTSVTYAVKEAKNNPIPNIMPGRRTTPSGLIKHYNSSNTVEIPLIVSSTN